MVFLSVGVLALSVLLLGYRFILGGRPLPPFRASADASASHEAPPEEGEDEQGRPSNPNAGMVSDSTQANSRKEGSPSTPKASSHDATIHGRIPTFSLGTTEDASEPTKPNILQDSVPSTGSGLKTDDNASMPPPSARVSTSRSRAPASAPKQSASSLMPPPSVRPSALQPLPRNGPSLNPPPSAAATLRKPSTSGLQPASGALAPSTSTLPPSKRASRKVILEPGHSPLDWANLTRNPPTPAFLRGAEVPPEVPPNRIRIPPSEIRLRNGRRGRDAWGTYQGRVYNLTPYSKFHPGGVGELMRGAGKIGDAERLFFETHPWVNWDNMLLECWVGMVGPEPDAERGSKKTNG